MNAQFHYDRAHVALLHLKYLFGYRGPLHLAWVFAFCLLIALLIAGSRLVAQRTSSRLVLFECIAMLGFLLASSTGPVPASHALAPYRKRTASIGPGASHRMVDMVEEEVLGPFASWADVRRDYGAVGDGVADDTDALQRALDDLGRVGKAQVLHLPAGTYKIAATLHWTGLPSNASFRGWGGLTLIGADPATTTIKWAGPAGQAMLIQNGGVGYRYNRITWDGSGTAGIGVAHWWNFNAGIIYGGAVEHQDEVFENMRIGIMAGQLGPNYGQMDSEGQIRRVTFLHDTYAGLDTGSFNALDWWVWESHFKDCARGVSNEYSVDEFGETQGAGAMYVYRSLFERSTVADMSIANTGWFSLHDNVSIGSRRFFEAAPMGRNAAVVIMQNNRVSRSTDGIPISLGNTGPLLLVDNQIEARRSAYELTDWITGRDVLSLGNRLTAPPPVPSESDRLISVDDVAVPATGIATQTLPLPATPGWSRHEVFEVPEKATSGQIQDLIDAAQRSPDAQAIVHFGRGTWTLNQSLQIPKNAHLQLVGDGYGSVLTWSGRSAAGPMLTVAAPGRVAIRDLQWLALGTTAIRIVDADQAGGRIQIVACYLGPVTAAHLEQTQLSLQTNPLTASLTFDDVTQAVAVASGPLGPVKLMNHSDFLMADTWYEGSDTALFRMNSATFTYLGGHMAPATHPGALDLADPVVRLDRFDGVASWLGMEFDLSAIPSGIGVRLDAETAGGHVYFIGTTSYVANYFRRTSGPRGSGTVGFMLNRTAAHSIDTQAPDSGAVSAEAIVDAWRQSRSLTWDVRPRAIAPGSVDIRLYHLKMDDTAGVVITGR